MKKLAFTLAEVVIVITIVSILGLVAIKTLSSKEVQNKALDKAAEAMDMAKAFMDDKDAQPDKLARYYKYIVKH